MADELEGADLTDLDTFANGFPHGLFRRHREVAPVWWHEPTAHTPDDEGFWSVACYDDVLRVLNDPVSFSSETGGGRPYGGTITQDLPVAGVVLNMMDDPRHAPGGVIKVPRTFFNESVEGASRSRPWCGKLSCRSPDLVRKAHGSAQGKGR